MEYMNEEARRKATGIESVNVGGNRVAAKRLGFQNADYRLLRFTALFVVLYV